MRDVFFAIVIAVFILYVIIIIQTPNYKADEVALLKDYPGWIVVNKTDDFWYGRELKIVNPDNKNKDGEDNYVYFYSYQAIFDKYEVGDTLKTINFGE